MEDLQALFDDLKNTPLNSKQFEKATVAEETTNDVAVAEESEETGKANDENETETELTAILEREKTPIKDSSKENSPPAEDKVMSSESPAKLYSNTNGQKAAVIQDVMKTRKCKVLIQRLNFEKYMKKMQESNVVNASKQATFSSPIIEQPKRRGRKRKSDKVLNDSSEVLSKRVRKETISNDSKGANKKRNHHNSNLLSQDHLVKMYGRRFFRSFVKIKRLRMSCRSIDEKVETEMVSPSKTRSVSFKNKVTILCNEVIVKPNDNIRSRFLNLLDDDDEEFQSMVPLHNSTLDGTELGEAKDGNYTDIDKKTAAFRLCKQLKIRNANEALKEHDDNREKSPSLLDTNTDTNGSFNDEILALPKSDISKKNSVSFSNVIEVFEVKSGANKDSPDNTSSVTLTNTSPVPTADNSKENDKVDGETIADKYSITHDESFVTESVVTEEVIKVTSSIGKKSLSSNEENESNPTNEESAESTFHSNVDTENMDSSKDMVTKVHQNPLLEDVQNDDAAIDDNSVSDKETESGTPLSIKANNSNSSDSFISAVDKVEIAIRAVLEDSDNETPTTCPEKQDTNVEEEAIALEDNSEKENGPIVIDNDNDYGDDDDRNAEKERAISVSPELRLNMSPIQPSEPSSKSCTLDVDFEIFKNKDKPEKILTSEVSYQSPRKTDSPSKRRREVTYALDADASLEKFPTETEQTSSYITEKSSKTQSTEMLSEDFVLNLDSEASNEKPATP